MFSAPTEFDKQDEGHTAHNPRSWKVIEKYYIHIGQYPYKYYNGKRVLTGPFAGTQSDNIPSVINHFATRKEFQLIRNIQRQYR